MFSYANRLTLILLVLSHRQQQLLLLHIRFIVLTRSLLDLQLVLMMYFVLSTVQVFAHQCDNKHLLMLITFAYVRLGRPTGKFSTRPILVFVFATH